MLVFGISAIEHVVGLWAVTPACDIGPTIRRRILMGFAVVFEDLVRRLFSEMKAGWQWERRGRALGYIWVWIYLAWSLPKVVFPNDACF